MHGPCTAASSAPSGGGRRRRGLGWHTERNEVRSPRGPARLAARPAEERLGERVDRLVSRPHDIAQVHAIAMTTGAALDFEHGAASVNSVADNRRRLGRATDELSGVPFLAPQEMARPDRRRVRLTKSACRRSVRASSRA